MLGEISLEHTFDAAHRVVGHKGKCANLHGHTYKVHILAVGEVREPGFVVDFGDLKDLVNLWDHKTLLWDQDPLCVISMDNHNPDDEHLHGVVRLPFNPTAEHMATHLGLEIYERFNLAQVLVELWETPKGMARFST